MDYIEELRKEFKKYKIKVKVHYSLWNENKLIYTYRLYDEDKIRGTYEFEEPKTAEELEDIFVDSYLT